MNRKLVAAVVAGLLLVASVVVLAAPTTEQLSELAALQAEKIALQKEFVAKQVELGLITQEQADFRLEQMEERSALCAENGYAPMGRGMGYGRMGSNRMGMGQRGGAWGGWQR